MQASLDAGRNEAPVRVFFSHAKADERFVERFARHLSALEAQGIIHRWSQRDIPPGATIEDVVQANLLEADLILLFVTADYLDTMDEEARCAVEQAKRRGVSVIPILVGPCLWEESRLRGLQALPRGGRAVTDFTDDDAAWSVIAREVMKVLRSAAAAPLASGPTRVLPGTGAADEIVPGTPRSRDADATQDPPAPALQRALAWLARWPVLAVAGAVLCVAAFVARAALPWPRLPPGTPGRFAAANILQHMAHVILLAGISLYIALVGRKLERSYLYYDNRARAFAVRCIAIVQMLAFSLSVNYATRLSVSMASCGVDGLADASGVCPGPGVYRALNVAFSLPGVLAGLLLFWLQLEWWNPFAGSAKHLRRLAWTPFLVLGVVAAPFRYWALVGWPEEGAEGWTAGAVTARALLSTPAYMLFFAGMVLVVSGLYARYRTSGVLGSLAIFLYAALQPVWPWAAAFPQNHWWLGSIALVCKLALFGSLVRPIRDGQIWQARSATPLPSGAAPAVRRAA